MAQQWYVRIAGTEQGPISGAELKRLAADGKLRPTDDVRLDGQTEWRQAAAIKGLFAAVASEHGPSAAAPARTAPMPASKPSAVRSSRPASHPTAATAALQADREPERSPRLKKRAAWLLVVATGVAGLCVVSTVAGIVLNAVRPKSDTGTSRDQERSTSHGPVTADLTAERSSAGTKVGEPTHLTEPVWVAESPDDWIDSLQLSQTARFVVTDQCRLFDLDRKKPVEFGRGSFSGFSAPGFSPSGELLAVHRADADRTGYVLFDYSGGQITEKKSMRCLYEPKWRLPAVWSHDSKLLLVPADDDRQVRVWNRDTDELRQLRFPDPPKELEKSGGITPFSRISPSELVKGTALCDAKFSPDNRYLTLSQREAGVHAFDVATGKVVASFSPAEVGIFGRVAYNPQGTVFATSGWMAGYGSGGGVENRIVFFDTQSWKPVSRVDSDAPMKFVDFLPDGQHFVAIQSRKGTSAVGVWDRTTGKQEFELGRIAERNTDSYFVVKGGSLLVVGGVQTRPVPANASEREVYAWDLPSRTLLAKLNDRLICAVAASGDGALLTTAHATPPGRRGRSQIKVWNLGTVPRPK